MECVNTATSRMQKFQLISWLLNIEKELVYQFRINLLQHFLDGNGVHITSLKRACQSNIKCFSFPFLHHTICKNSPDLRRQMDHVTLITSWWDETLSWPFASEQCGTRSHRGARSFCMNLFLCAFSLEKEALLV
jgi:hypothetical protein